MNWRPRSSTISGASRGASATETEYMELVDDSGNVIASFSQDTSGNVGLEVDSSPLMRIATTRVNTNVGTKQALLAAVPTGKVRIVTQVVARNASASLGAVSDGVNLGFNALSSDVGFIRTSSLAGLTTAAGVTICPVGVDVINQEYSPFTSGAAGDVFGCIFADDSITATLDIDVHYYDVDA